MQKFRIEIKWALIFAGVGLVWMLLERLVGLHDKYIAYHAVYTNIVAIPAIAVYVFALLDKRRNYYHGTMTFMQGFTCGLIMTAIITLLSPLTQYITSTFIAPHYFPNVISHSVQEGKLTQQEAEKYFNLNSYIVQGIFGAAIMGVLTSAIVALFTRTRVRTE